VGDTIIADNAPDDVDTGLSGFNSLGHNLFRGSDLVAAWYLNDNRTFDLWLGPNDPLLLDLPQYNGGPTPTMALLPGSPAIDQGWSFGLTTDQRGQPRALTHGKTLPGLLIDNRSLTHNGPYRI
jgi:hypothetical protein